MTEQYKIAKTYAPELGIALPITANDDVLAQWIKAVITAGKTGAAPLFRVGFVD